MKHQALVAHYYLDVPAIAETAEARADDTALATLLSNMAHYGYAPSLAAVTRLREYSLEQLGSFWRTLEPALLQLTGANRNMDRFVVYKNFPAEVLAKSKGEYWLSQILMYLGAPADWFAQDEVVRPALDERLSLKVLQLAQADTLLQLYRTLVAKPTRWSDAELMYAHYLHGDQEEPCLDLAQFGFKENGIRLLAAEFGAGKAFIPFKDATDVLRLAAAASGADVSLRTGVTFRSFKRFERRQLLAMLEQTNHLEDDFAARPALWKRLLSRLHPGDCSVERVQRAYHALYNNEIDTFNRKIERGIAGKDSKVLNLLATRPGDFVRRLHQAYGVFGSAAVRTFEGLVEKLDTLQLLKISRYITTVNHRQFFAYPPRGNWSKMQVGQNTKVPFRDEDITAMVSAIQTVLAKRLNAAVPNGVALDHQTELVKLPTSDAQLAAYGRGTVFQIPEEMTFLRTASYWRIGGHGIVWFDVGWNFFDAEWQPRGECCWDSPFFEERERNKTRGNEELVRMAVFSGDPVISQDEEGRGCQMIDLYLDALQEQGVRYAVWNVLAYSGIPFEEAEDVLATLQWGTDAEAGDLYEPARAQMVFPLKGKSLTKYVAYVDVQERKLVFMDANLPGDVSAASRNGPFLSKLMPAYVEYLDSLPSVADLFCHAKEGATPVLYSDAQEMLADGQAAYVFRPENPENNFTALDVTTLLQVKEEV